MSTHLVPGTYTSDFRSGVESRRFCRCWENCGAARGWREGFTRTSLDPKNPLEWVNTRLVDRDPIEAVRSMKEAGAGSDVTGCRAVSSW